MEHSKVSSGQEWGLRLGDRKPGSFFAEPWETPALMVVGAAFYSEPNLKAVGELPWLSRVPMTLKAAQTRVDSAPDSLTERPCEVEGYRLWNGSATARWNSAGFWWKVRTGRRRDG